MTTLAQKTYVLLRTVPKGRVTTYKELAHALGTKAYRAIGQAMRNNPYAPEVPCHRVVASNGAIGGFMGKRDGLTIEKKQKMLQEEGVIVSENKILNFHQLLYRFN